MPLCPTRASAATAADRSIPVRRDWGGTPTPDPKRWFASTTVAALAAVALGLGLSQFPGAHVLFMEDGPIESLQAILLLGISVVFAVAFWWSAGSRAFFCLLAAYACIFAVTRELPRCGSEFVGGEVCLPSTWKRSIVLVASALGLVALVLRPIDWRSALKLSNLRWVWPSAIVLGFLVAAEALESLIYYSEVEEFLELVAYLHLGAMALSILRRTARS